MLWLIDASGADPAVSIGDATPAYPGDQCQAYSPPLCICRFTALGLPVPSTGTTFSLVVGQWIVDVKTCMSLSFIEMEGDTDFFMMIYVHASLCVHVCTCVNVCSV